MIERRRADRMAVDMEVQKHRGGDSYYCRACEISPSGIRLRRIFDLDESDELIDIEVPLVVGGLTTAIPSRRVWRKDGFEAFEFVGQSFAQQAMLEKLYGGC